jgi:hypothetical protein
VERQQRVTRDRANSEARKCLTGSIRNSKQIRISKILIKEKQPFKTCSCFSHSRFGIFQIVSDFEIQASIFYDAMRIGASFVFFGSG